MAPLYATLAAAMMLQTCEAWSWISSALGGSSYGTVSGSAAAVSPEASKHMLNEAANALDYVTDTAQYWWTGYDKAYDNCVAEFVYGTTPEGNLWTAGYRHTPVALQTYCGNLWSYMNNTATTAQWRDYAWQMYEHYCSVANQVAYPGCVDWMPDDCLIAGTGEFKPECYETATLNQACYDIAVATGCDEKAYETTTILNKDITTPPEDAYTNFKEVRDALAEESDKNIMSMGNEMVDGMLANCEFASMKGTFEAVQAAINQMMGTSCLELAHRLMVLENIMTSAHVDDRCPVGIQPTECYSYVQYHTGGVPEWVPYVALAGAVAFVAGPAVMSVWAKKQAACYSPGANACLIGWSAGKKTMIKSELTKYRVAAAAKGTGGHGSQVAIAGNRWESVALTGKSGTIGSSQADKVAATGWNKVASR